MTSNTLLNSFTSLSRRTLRLRGSPSQLRIKAMTGEFALRPSWAARWTYPNLKVLRGRASLERKPALPAPVHQNLAGLLP